MPNLKLRKKLLQQALANNLVLAELGKLITLHRGEKQSGGGRKPKSTVSSVALSLQLADETEKWCRRCELVWTTSGKLNVG